MTFQCIDLARMWSDYLFPLNFYERKGVKKIKIKKRGKGSSENVNGILTFQCIDLSKMWSGHSFSLNFHEIRLFDVIF